jgi:TolB-like protein/DNA-binding winged helix-turn-helix (wHTH) protein
VPTQPLASLDFSSEIPLTSLTAVEVERVIVVSSAHVPATRQIAQFGPFQFDFHSSEIFKNGKKFRVQDHSIQILAVLLEKPGEVVTREELRQCLWHSQTFVDFEQGLNTAIMRLRHALEDSAEVPKFIETLPRLGYRFIAPVTFSGGLSEPEKGEVGHQDNVMGPSQAQDDRRPTKSSNRVGRRWVRAGVIAAFSVIAASLLVTALGRGNLRRLLFPVPPTVEVPTLAVLPLDSLSNDGAQKFLAESMTEQLITELGQSRGLRVISRGSVMRFSDKHLPLETVAKELQVDNILEGSAAESGGRLRVTANLYQVATRKHLWAETYETTAGDDFSPQREIVLDIAQKIQTKLAPR